jgi:cytoskeletal protein RodZ
VAYDFEQLDHYQLLNVARGASLNEIKKAFRREITSYHPDRYVRASSEEKHYARTRSQRINEAFRVLRDSKLREHYDLTMPGGVTLRPSQPVPTGPLAPRDHHAEMYETAKAHIDAGRLLQAVAVLRRLQQSNPFYRDASTLLVNTEQAINARQLTMPYESVRRTSWLTVSVVVMVVVIVGVTWLLNDQSAISGARIDATQTAEAQITPATVTRVITRTPRSTPTRPAVATATPMDANVLLDDTFETNDWASATGATWSTRYDGKQYHITAQANSDAAWTYRPFDQADVVVSADMHINSGQAGIIVRYRAETNYVAVVLIPATQEYRVVQRQDVQFVEITRGQNPAITADNLLDVRVVGKQLDISINGSVAASVTIDTMADSARFGMIGIPDTSNADVFYSRLTVQKP